MAPIMSPKLLSQILMHGYAAVLAEPKQLPLLPLSSIIRPVVVVNTQKAITAATPPPQLATIAYGSMPNCMFVHNGEDTEEANLAADMPVIPNVMTLAARDSVTSGSLSEVEMRTDTPSSASLTVSSGFASTTTSARSSPIESPSTDVTSLPPWCLPRDSTIPRASAPRYVRTRPPPVDSLKITRERRASEGAGGDTLFISRPHKKSDASGLKALGLRILKRVKW
ncbi:hypothetical protein FRC07_012884 [Ceratobasidium sp. 392]|nr:hypothetical protein FRC07_012884 [Ceratobasidium sp. 392]